MKLWLVQADDVRSAISTARRRPWRSLMTMLGIILSIISVVSVVSIGEGIKRQVSTQITQFGSDVITVRPGTVAFNGNTILHSFDAVVNPVNGSTLSTQDLQTVRSTPQVVTAVPLAIIPGSVKPEGVKPLLGTNATVIATQSGLPEVLRYSVAYGAFFSPEDYGKNVAVIGSDLADTLFRSDVPLGETFTFRNQQFIVRGVMQKYDAPLLSQHTDLNEAIFIPLQTAEQLEAKSVPLYEILAKSSSPRQINATAATITQRLHAAHGQVQDFTVLKPSQNITIASNILDLLTRLIIGIATIALVVGGVGIMNIMWLLVTERTREIGIRKAIGATNRQILAQFLAEVVVLCGIGSLLGILGAVLVNVLLRIVTDLQPVWPWSTMVISTAVAIVVGIIFGMAPAIKAARKEPIEALRNE